MPSDPDIFVCGVYYQDAVAFVEAAARLGFAPKATVMTIGPSNPAFVGELGAKAGFLLSPTQWHCAMPPVGPFDPLFGAPLSYDGLFRTRFGRSASYQAAESSVCGVVLQRAIEAAGVIDTDAVLRALRVLDLKTFFGDVRFDETGKNVAKTMGLTQVLGGVLELVRPDSGNADRLVYPVPK